MMATNYNELAVANDGSCEYPTSETCEEAIAMESSATGSTGSGLVFKFRLIHLNMLLHLL